MKICIFGADGRTGKEIVNYAKNKGFEIVAFVFNENSLSFVKDNIKIIKGNVLDYDKVLEACTGSDIVISVLGHVRGSDPRMQAKGMINIVSAMKERGMLRILSLTGTGVRLPDDTPSYMDKLLNCIVKIIDPIRIEDAIEHAKVLQNSDLDWTIVRVLKLSNSQKDIEKYTLTMGGPAELLTSRKKVSKVIIDSIENINYFGKMPVISA